MGQPDQPTRVVIEGRSMSVLYGTETGNAEEIAVEVGKMAERLRFQTTVDEMDSFKLADVLRTSLAIFVVSTTGQGDMPKNTLKFWKNLRREKLNNSNCLRSLRFAIFGLGDSSYLKFNWAARKLRARLLQLGATEFFRAGEGDERHDNGIDSIYFPWYSDLKSTLTTDFPLPESVLPIPDDVQLPPKYSLEMLPTAMEIDLNLEDNGTAPAPPLSEYERKFLASRTLSAACSHVDHPLSAQEQFQERWRRLSAKFPADYARRDEGWERTTGQTVESLDKDNILRDHPQKYLCESRPPKYVEFPEEAQSSGSGSPIIGTVVRNDRVTPMDHWQDVRHLVFKVRFPPDYLKAITDCSGHLTLTLWPKNYPEDVQELIDMMGWGDDADKIVRVGTRPRGLYVQHGLTSLRHLLTHNLDITAVPKRGFIKELIYLTKDEREIERLAELTAPGNEQEFYDYTCRPRRTILELLRDFTNVKIPPDMVLDIFPIIRGRDFSVCNAGRSLAPARNGDTNLEILAALVEYKTIIRKPRQGLCSRYIKHLPLHTNLSLALKPASGHHLVKDAHAASRPLIAIATGTGIAPIRAILQQRALSPTAGETLLFFGCRNRAADFHFSSEWPAYPNLYVFPAFSRDFISPEPETTTLSAAQAAAKTEEDDSSDSSDSSDSYNPNSPSPHPKPLPPLTPPQYDISKNYVQHLIRKHAAEVGAVMRRRPIVCICGNAGKMPVSVKSALLDALVLSGVVETLEEAERWFGREENVSVWQETW
ncbi:NAPDH-dependent diflavin reductase [Collariella sp. IMI 366227]|nr:NAPDH-dependent diflavin reductase [Collariella sp. IMI 366227]